MNFDPSEVTLKSVAKMFEYEKIAREIDECDDVNMLRLCAKCFLKLQMRQQEITNEMFASSLGMEQA